MTKETDRENHQHRRLRSAVKANVCEHKGNKIAEGNKIRCGDCKMVVGFLRKPGKK